MQGLVFARRGADHGGAIDVDPDAVRLAERLGEADAEDMPASKMPPLDPVVVLNFSSKNKEGVNKLLAQYLGSKNDKGYYSIPLPGGYVVNVVDNKIGYTLSNDADLVAMIAAKGTLGPLPDNVSDLVKKNASVGYLDLNADHYPDAVKSLIAAASHDRSMAATMEYMKLFRDITVTGNTRDSEADLNFAKGEGNTLFRLFAQADLVYKVSKANAATEATATQ